jgi:cytochrome c oxidase assembly protein subunit 15
LFVSYEVLEIPKRVKYFALLLIVLSFVQMQLGLQVREQVDYWHNTQGVFVGIIEKLDMNFKIHRTFSVLILVMNIWFYFLSARFGATNRWSAWILPIIFVEILTGVILANFDLPQFSQPFHLLLSSLLIGMQFLNFLYLKFAIENK